MPQVGVETKETTPVAATVAKPKGSGTAFAEKMRLARERAKAGKQATGPVEGDGTTANGAEATGGATTSTTTATVVVEKKPHEMKPSEFRKLHPRWKCWLKADKDGLYMTVDQANEAERQIKKESSDQHREIVAEAYKSGATIPEEVLKHYPEVVNPPKPVEEMLANVADAGDGVQHGDEEQGQQSDLAMGRKERLAISLPDLDRLDPEVRKRLLKGRLDLNPIKANIPHGKSVREEVFVRFSCPLLEAGKVCDVVRAEDKRAGDDPTRVYILRPPTTKHPDAEWTKLPGTATFTVPDVPEGVDDPKIMAEAEWILNPKVFPAPKEELELSAPVPPPVSRVAMPRR